MSEYCVCCGEEIPEGRQVCPQCEKEAKRWRIPKEFLVEGGNENDRNRSSYMD